MHQTIHLSAHHCLPSTLAMASLPLNGIFHVWDLRCRKCLQKIIILPGLQYHVGLVVLTKKASQPGEGDKKKKMGISFDETRVRETLFCCKPLYFLTGYVCYSIKTYWKAITFNKVTYRRTLTLVLRIQLEIEKGTLLGKGRRKWKSVLENNLQVLIDYIFLPRCFCWGSWEEGSWEWSCPGISGFAVGAAWQKDLQIQSLPCPPCTLSAGIAIV